MARDPTLKQKLLGILALVVVAIAIIGVLATLVGGWTIVNDGERGVYTRMGEVQGTVGPGFHLKIPLIDSISTYSVRTQAYTMSSQSGEGDKKLRDDSIEALTEEGLNIKIDMTTRYRLNPSKVDYLYTNVGKQEAAIVERIIRPTSRTAARSCSANYSVEGIYSDKREEYAQCVTERINAQFAQKGIVLETIQVRNIMLPTRVRKAIQKKQAAQERIQQKKKQLKIAKLEAERKRTEAKGIRDSQRIINKTLTDQYLQYLWITEGIEKGDPIYVPINGDGMQMYKNVDNTRGAGNSTAENQPQHRTAPA